MTELETALRGIAASWRRYPRNAHLQQLAEGLEDGADAIAEITELDRWIHLESVGTIMDAKEGIIYPANVDGSPARASGTHIVDACDEWRDSLSNEDRRKVRAIAVRYPRPFMNQEIG